jgi:hypothetical protein
MNQHPMAFAIIAGTTKGAKNGRNESSLYGYG